LLSIPPILLVQDDDDDVDDDDDENKDDDDNVMEHVDADVVLAVSVIRTGIAWFRCNRARTHAVG
jgi:hypothetical protein